MNNILNMFLFFFIILVCAVFTAKAQDVGTFTPEKGIERKLQFLYTNKPLRKDMFVEMNEREKPIILEHFNYLKMLRKKGLLILAGPNLDNTFGIVIFFAASKEEAETIMANDPAIKKEIMTAELHPFRVSLMYDFTQGDN